MIQFRLFGIPVRVEPWFWVTGFLIGGGISARDKRDLIFVGLWMVIVFVSILVHELGHALSGRWLGGGRQSIRLWAFGGLAYNEGGRFTQRNRILMILAGPGAGFLLFFSTVGVIFLLYPGMTGLHILDFFIRQSFAAPVNAEAFDLLLQWQEQESPTLEILHDLVWINLWWGLVNLLPVHPLDGGQVTAEIVPSRKNVHTVGLITASLVAGAALLWMQDYFIAILFGLLAWQNYEQLKRHQF